MPEEYQHAWHMSATPWSSPESDWFPPLGCRRGRALACADEPDRLQRLSLDSPQLPPLTPLHPLAPLDLDRQIPKRGDQRQMEPWQRTGVFAAGLALDSAGMKGNTELLSRMGMIVAAGGGERDYARSTPPFYPATRRQPNPGTYLNEHLQGDLRPTLFLAQLSNLLAGNISIVHGVIGSSRTFMGEEGSRRRCRTHCLCPDSVGSVRHHAGWRFAYNAQRPDVLLQYEMGGLVAARPHSTPDLGSASPPAEAWCWGRLGCFLVIESRAHAAGQRGVSGVCARSRRFVPTDAGVRPGRSDSRMLAGAVLRRLADRL